MEARVEITYVSVCFSILFPFSVFVDTGLLAVFSEGLHEQPKMTSRLIFGTKKFCEKFLVKMH